MSPACRRAIDFQKNDPQGYARWKAAKALRNWMRNLRAAQRGEGFFKVDHCEAMIQLHLSRYRNPK
jgi:hypothetical protein